IDAASYRPLRIEWRERAPGGQERTAAVISIREATAVAADSIDPTVLDLELPAGTRVTQLAAPGTAVRLLGTRRLTLAQARALRPVAWWLGRRYGFHRLTRITLLEYTGGTAVRLSYGPGPVWVY